MRVVVYDRTCVTGRRGLSPVWSVGTRFYRALRRIDGAHGVASWGEAFDWLLAQTEPITEVQYWGHGKWGRALIDSESFDRDWIDQHPGELAALRERLAPNALVWFRTCETFGARPGIAFAEHLADTLGARVAGHTYIVAFHQSGLHGLHPGTRADWSPHEGLLEGTPDEPERAKWSKLWAPRTVTALTSAVPEAWFSRG